MGYFERTGEFREKWWIGGAGALTIGFLPGTLAPVERGLFTGMQGCVRA